MDKYEPKLGLKRLNPKENETNKEAINTLFCLYRDGFLPLQVIFESFEVSTEEELIQIVTGISPNDFTINSIKHNEKGNVQIGIGVSDESSQAAKLIQTWATNFLKMLDERKCQNYLEMNLICNKTERSVIVTIIHENGKTPHQFRKELEAENAALKKDFEALEAENALLKIQLNK
jgi:hypothetical protein